MHKIPRMLFVVPLAVVAALAQAPPRLSVSSGPGAENTSQTLESSSPPETVKPAVLKPATAAAADIPFHDSEFQTEQQLLLLANQSRQQAGAPALMLNAGLSRAARIHAQAMLEARQLSHRFEGEASLPERLAALTDLQLDQEGENVALDYSAEGGHQHLMLSPPHRANLLNPAYNVVGLGVVRSGDRLYIVQDFGHALPNYSPAEVKDRIAAAVNQLRRQSGLSDLQRKDVPDADGAACSMARADKLGTPAVHQLSQRSAVLSFTSLHPETLPAGADHAIASRNLSTLLIGACYGKTDTYPTGVYWVVLSLD
jgi:uncharacterized protein YkwD